MTRHMLGGLALLILMMPASARATIGSCAEVVDGTACSDACIAHGSCQGGVCAASQLRPDGTSCSTNDACTTGDQCQAGVCQAGAAIVCPGLSACLVGACEPLYGCTVQNICPADLAVAVVDLGAAASADMAAGDAAVASADMGVASVDLAGATPSDLSSPANQSEIDAAFTVTVDVDIRHVRGSHIGDCSLVTGETAPASSLALLLFVLGCIVARRRVRVGGRVCAVKSLAIVRHATNPEPSSR